MSLLLLLTGLQTPDADIPVPPVTPTVTGPQWGGGSGYGGLRPKRLPFAIVIEEQIDEDDDDDLLDVLMLL